MRHIKILIKTFMCLLNKNYFLEDLIAVDHQEELETNKQLREADEQCQQRHKSDLREGTLKRRKLLSRKLWYSGIWLFIAIGMGVVISFKMPAMGNFSRYAGVASMLCFSWATLGRLGWSGQTIKGETVFEKLDTAIFWILYFFGTLLGVISISLH